MLKTGERRKATEVKKVLDQKDNMSTRRKKLMKGRGSKVSPNPAFRQGWQPHRKWHGQEAAHLFCKQQQVLGSNGWFSSRKVTQSRLSFRKVIPVAESRDGMERWRYRD